MTATTTAINLASITPILTTIFAPTATGCLDNKLTMLANRGYQIWNNIPVPVAGTTFSDCFPSQYMSSYLLLVGGVTQPAFAPLVCPQSWTTLGPFTSNYIACCPNGYSLANPTVSVISDRPAFGGTCYSDLTSGSSYLLTQYGSSSVTATTFFPITTTNAQAYAYPIDGYAYGVAALASVSTSSGIVSKTSSSSAASATSINQSYVVGINAQQSYSPSELQVIIGDTIDFQFNSGNHSITQSTFSRPCTPLAGGYDSGFLVNTGNSTAGSPIATLNVTTTDPQFFYSKGLGDCAAGMVFITNPSVTESFPSFQAAAISSSSTKKSNSVAIGVGVGVSLAAIISGCFAFFLWRRSKQRKAATHAAIGSDVDGHMGEEIEQKVPGTSEQDMDTARMPEMSLLGNEEHELHSYATPYEMGGGHHYEMEGSHQFKR